MTRQHRENGFTLAEVLIVLTVIGILAAIVLTSYGGWRERTYLTRADNDLTTIANATRLYVNKHNTYPPDVSRNIPAEIKEFISSNVPASSWPSAPWPGSVFDYESWDIDNDSLDETIQISIRFCPLGGGIETCRFPDQPWASDFGTNSAYYYCIKGYCRAHKALAANYPGYCVNCPDNAAIKLPTE